MLDMIEKYVTPRINECFERYNFLKRNQKEAETFEHFLTNLKHLIRSCNYNTINANETVEDKALRDKIVMGIMDPVTREALLRIDNLTLEKAIQHCTTSEQSRTQNRQFEHEMSSKLEVNKVNRNLGRFGRRDQQKRTEIGDRFNKYSNKSTENFLCKRCQRVHGVRECPAYGKKCNKCGILNHFAKSCKVRNIKNVEEEEGESSCSEIFIGSVNVNENVNMNKNVNKCSNLNCNRGI